MLPLMKGDHVKYSSETPIMSRYVRAVRIMMGYNDYNPETNYFSDWVMFSASTPLSVGERNELVGMAGANFKDLVLLEFDAADVTVGPSRIGVAAKHPSNNSWLWYSDFHMVTGIGPEPASLVPLDPRMRFSFHISSENRLTMRKGRPMRQAFERGRRMAAKRLREVSSSDASIPPRPFIVSLPEEMTETTLNYFSDRAIEDGYAGL